MRTSSERPPDAVVLAGGNAHRLGGVDKPALYVGGATILDRALDALPPCGRVVVVGPPRPTAREVLWTREEPAGAGPVAAIEAGLELVTAPQVLVVAGDMPFLTSSVLSLLLRAMAADGALLLDDDGREQYLCSAWETEALRGAVHGVTRVKDVVGRLAFARVSVPAGVAAPWTDCDTPGDLIAARETDMTGMSTVDDWVTAVRDALGLTDEVDVALLLDVAREAAHAVARPAAPVTTYLLGLAVARGADPTTAVDLLTELAREWPTPTA